MLSLADSPPAVPLTPLAALPFGTAEGAIVLWEIVVFWRDVEHCEEVLIYSRSEPLKCSNRVQ